MNIISFEDLQHEVFGLYAQQSYSQALEIMKAAGSQFPDQMHRLMFWQVCFHNLLEDQQAALTLMEQAVTEGFWFGEAQLRRDPDLASLQGVPEFERLASVCLLRRAEAQKSARPQRLVTLPDSKPDVPLPMLFALHGSNSRAADHVGYWRPAARHGWLVVALQSSHISGMDTYDWKDAGQAAADVQFHLTELKQQYEIDASRIIVGGFSRGAQMSAELAFTQPVPVRGCIAVCASIHADVAYWQALYADSKRPKIGLYFMAGDQDTRFYQPTLRLGELLDDWGIPNRVKVYRGIGHVYPPDFEQVLGEAIEFISRH